MTLAQIKPGQLKTTLPGVRPMQLQQIPISQQQPQQQQVQQVSVPNMTLLLFVWLSITMGLSLMLRDFNS